MAKMLFCAFFYSATNNLPFLLSNGDKCIFKHYKEHPEAASEVTIWGWL